MLGTWSLSSDDPSRSIVLALSFTSERLFVTYHMRDIPCSVCMTWYFSTYNRMKSMISAWKIKWIRWRNRPKCLLYEQIRQTFLCSFLTSSPVTTWETRFQFLWETPILLFSLTYTLGLQQPTVTDTIIKSSTFDLSAYLVKPICKTIRLYVTFFITNMVDLFL